MPIDKNGKKYIIVGADRHELPPRFKYFNNGKTIQENYNDIIKERRRKAAEEREFEKRLNAELEK